METLDINSYTCVPYTCVPTTLFFLFVTTILDFLITAIFLSTHPLADYSNNPDHELKNNLEDSEDREQKTTEPFQEGLLPEVDIPVSESLEGIVQSKGGL